MAIPRLTERLECMLYRRKLELDIEDIRPELNILRNASRELRSSLKFKKLLQVRPCHTELLRWNCLLYQIVLTLGNVLNGSSFRGGALGFQLDALSKVRGISCGTLVSQPYDHILQLKETKTARGETDCPTLLHYLARVILRTDPSLATFIDEMPNLEAAARGMPA